MAKIKKWDFELGGFKFKVIDSDFDYFDARSLPRKFNDANVHRYERLKEQEEHDFTYAEYDCTGSTKVWLEMVRMKNIMWVEYHWRKDV